MKKTIIALLAFGLLVSLGACNNYETYGDKKKKERKAISEFLADSAINVIRESEFRANGYVTDTVRNEFVYMDNSGVYMQIVRKGCGTPLQDGETATLLVRFMEICLLDSAALYNDTSPYDPDYMSVTRNGSTFTASFTSGLWASSYGNGSAASVPMGLLVPFNYINVGRPRSADDQVAKVRLIVPHSQGHTIASSYVYPYYYELTFQRQIDLYDTH